MQHFKTRLYWSSLHFLISLAVILFSYFYVINVWFYNGLDALTDMAFIGLTIISLDLIIGPVFTLFFLSPNKSNKENLINLTFIALLQLVSFVYGMMQLQGQQVNYFVNYRAGIYTVLCSESACKNSEINFYQFIEPPSHSPKRASYEQALKEQISPLYMTKHLKKLTKDELLDVCHRKAIQKPPKNSCYIVSKKGRFTLKFNDDNWQISP